MGRIIKEAFYIARTGRPGPVVIDLPKDVMAELGSPEYPQTVNIRGYKPNTEVHIGQLKRAMKMLNKAKKPLFLAGGGVKIANAVEIFTKNCRHHKDSGSDNDHGKRVDSYESPTVYRKFGHAWSICGKYGSQ